MRTTWEDVEMRVEVEFEWREVGEVAVDADGLLAFPNMHQCPASTAYGWFRPRGPAPTSARPQTFAGATTATVPDTMDSGRIYG